MPDYEDRLRLRLGERWWDDLIVVKWRPQCVIRVLMVADGATFDAGGGYRVSRVLEALRHDLPSYVRMDITTARHGSVSADASADVNGLRFDQHDLSRYDQIWLFAVSPGNSLAAGEATALWEFMQGGGGVFATGDHEALGEGLCGRVPRVRSMRRWYFPAPGPNGEPVAPARDVGGGRGENDSTTTAGGSDFDGRPQTIRPVLYSSQGPFVFTARDYPHPVLCGAGGRITVLPDHMHEGVVEVPADLEMPISVDGVAVEEYPRAGADRLPPEVIAYSTVNNNPAGHPFGVIGVYDGHQVDEITGGVGRVVVDATWHHFWNMNVEQFASAHDAVRQATLAGTPVDPAWVAPAAAWEQIRDYFQNIAFWLARRSTQACVRRRGLWILTQHVDVLMALASHQFDRVGHLADLGAKARDALQRVARQCETLRLTWELPLLVEFLPWWRIPIPDPPWERQIPLLEQRLLDDVVLGAQVEAMARLTAGAGSADEVAELLGRDDVDTRLAEAAAEAIRELGGRLAADAKRLARMAGPGRRAD
ncbi:MAG TPA: hypothetical protein VGD67_04335 [Pseudonocardiaceae bacterium]